MKTVINLICVLLLGFLIYPEIQPYTNLPVMPDAASYFTKIVPSSDITVVKPADTYGFDTSLPPLLVGKLDVAQSLTGMFSGMADCIEGDGTIPDPELKFCGQIKDKLKSAIKLNFTLQHKKLSDVVPGLGILVQPVSDKLLPDDNAVLTPELRAKAVSLFRALSYGTSQAK